MKVRFLVGAFAAMFAVTLGLALVGAEGARDEGGDEARVRAGLQFAKKQGIDLSYKKRNKELAGLGSYLVNAVGGCNDCHTAPPFTTDPGAFLGASKQVNVQCYLAGGTPFGPPPFGLPPNSPVSRNLTPHADGKPAGLSFDEFDHLMRTGEDPDNPGQLLRVMPWPVYQEMTSRDLRAIYEYLSSIPGVDAQANACGVPSI